jgi:single-stranded-DNA-specific exonuclease
LNATLAKWRDPVPMEIDEALLSAAGGSRLLAEILVRRGITSADQALPFLHPEKYTPIPAADFTGIAQAADYIINAIEKKQRIGVWGDFDVDGQTSTAVLLESLIELGGDVVFHVPRGGRDPHGIETGSLKEFLKQDISLIVTCDTGISEVNAIDYAKSLGVGTIITDHHMPPVELPAALAIVNSAMLDENHPLQTLSGVGVAYKLVEELYARFGRHDRMSYYLDLVALGMVADLVPLVGETRYLVQMGLQALRKTKRVGLLQLFRFSETEISQITTDTISYTLAPRLNALGRIGGAAQIVELFTTGDLEKAEEIARDLEGANSSRKTLTESVLSAAINEIERDRSLLEDPVLLLSHPEWPGNVIGIVASQLSETYHRPAVVISSPEGQPARASARSVEGIDIIAALAENKDYLQRFGGHPKAAGFSIDPEKIGDFHRDLNRTIERMARAVPEMPEVQIDSYLSLEEADSISQLEVLEQMSPFGPGNPLVTLACEQLKLVNFTTFGKSQDHRILTVETPSLSTHRIIWWRGANQPPPPEIFDLAYHLRPNFYRESLTTQIEYVSSRPVEITGNVQNEIKLEFQIIDLRGLENPFKYLTSLDKEIQIWAEGNLHTELPVHNRLELKPATGLAILTTPPGYQVLKGVMEDVEPEEVYIFGLNPSTHQKVAFINALMEKIHEALHEHSGWIDLQQSAANTAQEIATVVKTLNYLTSKTSLRIVDRKENCIQIDNQGSPDTAAVQQAAFEAMNELLEETAAYRRSFQRGELTYKFQGITIGKKSSG